MTAVVKGLIAHFKFTHLQDLLIKKLYYILFISFVVCLLYNILLLHKDDVKPKIKIK